MFHQFPPTNNRRHLIDRQICICKRFYRLRFRNVICHVILSTHHVVLLLVVLSCVLVMSCFGHILLKKAGLDSGLWTLDSGPPPAPMYMYLEYDLKNFLTWKKRRLIRTVFVLVDVKTEHST